MPYSLFETIFPTAEGTLSSILTENACTDIVNKLTKSHRNLDSLKPVEVESTDHRSFYVYPTWDAPDHSQANLFFVEIPYLIKVSKSICFLKSLGSSCSELNMI